MPLSQLIIHLGRSRNILKPICSQPPIRNSDNNWVKSDIQNSHTFANNLSEVFSPNSIMPSNNILQEVDQALAETIDYRFKHSN